MMFNVIRLASVLFLH